MADTHETTADIIAEMCDLAAHRDWHNHTGQSNRERLSHLADRLEAAHKRERGDCAKLREALENAYSLLCEGIATEVDDELEHPFHLELACEKIQAALTVPPRQCDVGTAQEQIKRWQAFCNRYDDDCTGCPCEAADTWDYTGCFAKWAQMPYEEGGAK